MKGGEWWGVGIGRWSFIIKRSTPPPPPPLFPHSVALNLTCASYCFTLDVWWNPAVERQAQGEKRKEREREVGSRPARCIVFQPYPPPPVPPPPPSRPHPPSGRHQARHRRPLHRGGHDRGARAGSAGQKRGRVRGRRRHGRARTDVAERRRHAVPVFVVRRVASLVRALFAFRLPTPCCSAPPPPTAPRSRAHSPWRAPQTILPLFSLPPILLFLNALFYVLSKTHLAFCFHSLSLVRRVRPRASLSLSKIVAFCFVWITRF